MGVSNLNLNKMYIGDSIELCKKIPDNYVNLLVTSPPYADIKSYGDAVNVFHPDQYVDWVIPLFQEASRFLCNDGSLIFNINDKVMNGKRHTYVFELVYRVAKETNLYLHDRYIWGKKNGMPSGSEPRRLDDRIEWIFHFVPKVFGSNGKELKKPNKFKANLKGLREPHVPITLVRNKKPSSGNKITNSDGTAQYERKIKLPNPDGRIPTTVFGFNNAACLPKDSASVRHPAPFHPEIPEWFIDWLTDEGDVVLDPFMGSGSTALAAQTLNRNWIGFDLNETYKELTEQRLSETYNSHVQKRDENGNLTNRYTL